MNVFQRNERALDMGMCWLVIAFFNNRWKSVFLGDHKGYEKHQ